MISNPLVQPARHCGFLVFLGLLLAGCAQRSDYGTKHANFVPGSSSKETSQPYLAAAKSDLSNTRKMTDEEIRTWQSQVRRQFDFEQLTKFLLETIKANPHCGDVDLSKTMVGREWTTDLNRMTSGDWQFNCDVRTEIFELSYLYSPNKIKSFVLKCRRLDSRHFELVKIDTLVQLLP